MDGGRFDTWTTVLIGGGARRTVLRTLIAGALAGRLARSGRGAAAGSCKNNGKPCAKDKNCCSHSCKRGTCRCAKVQRPCTHDSHSDPSPCCRVDGVAMACMTNYCASGDVCCRHLGMDCAESCDCCSYLICATTAGAKRCCMPNGTGWCGGDDDCWGALVCKDLKCQFP